MSKRKKGSVILPGDIPVEADRYQTVLSPVVSNLAASFLSLPLDPLEMGVTSPCGSLADFKYLIALDKRKIERLRKRVRQLLQKYL